MARSFSPAFFRVVVLLCAGLFALYAGFARFTPDECARLARLTGYWWVLVLVTATLAALVWCIRETGRDEFWRAAWPGRGHTAFLALLSLWVIGMDRPGHKVLFDESVLSSTALTMHHERELGVTTRAYPLPSLFTILRTHLDKRPPMFPFLVSTLHDLTGFRPENPYYVNMAGTVGLLWLVWLLGRRYGGSPAAGSVAAALLATFPEIGVCATGAGMDQINLLLLAAAWLAALAYQDRPGPARAGLLVAAILLLTYCRYESVLYVGAAGLVWLATAQQRRQWLPEVVWAVLPIGLLLYAWHNTVLSHSPEQWELRAEQTQRFSLSYAVHNLEHAVRFLFTPLWSQPSSVVLSVGGLAGGAWLAIRLLRRRARLEQTPATALAAFGGVIAVNFALLMCYYWGELDDPIVTRLALPLHLLLALLAVTGWREVLSHQAAWGGWRWPGLAVATATLVLTVPATALARYSETNLMRKNIEWERRVVAEYWPAPDLIISNRSPLVWLSEGMPSISLDRARLRGAELHWHLRRHTFSTVLVAQRILTLGKDGGWVVDATEQLPPDWTLEEVAVRRVGVTLTRISRLVDVPETSAPPPPPPDSAKRVSPAFKAE